MKKQDGRERRRVQRTILEHAYIDVFKERPQQITEFRGKICDLSTLGAKFVSSRPYDKGTEVYIGLVLPNHGSLIDVAGRVVRCEESVSGEYNIAVEFKEDYYQQSLIKDYIRMMELREKYIKFNVGEETKSL